MNNGTEVTELKFYMQFRLSLYKHLIIIMRQAGEIFHIKSRSGARIPETTYFRWDIMIHDGDST